MGMAKVWSMCAQRHWSELVYNYSDQIKVETELSSRTWYMQRKRSVEGTKGYEKWKFSAGLDGIDVTLLKHGREIMVNWLRRMVNDRNGKENGA